MATVYVIYDPRDEPAGVQGLPSGGRVATMPLRFGMQAEEVSCVAEQLSKMLLDQLAGR